MSDWWSGSGLVQQRRENSQFWDMKIVHMVGGPMGFTANCSLGLGHLPSDGILAFCRVNEKEQLEWCRYKIRCGEKGKLVADWIEDFGDGGGI